MEIAHRKMSNKNKQKKMPHGTSLKKKISEMVIAFASDYIALGKNLEEKQNYLNAACIAWNIAILQKNQRDFALDKFLQQYKMINPNADESEIENVKHDMELLIQEKLRLFPHVKNPIVSAKITFDKGKEKVIALSMGTH